jgi:hypothetical protein
MTQLDLLYAQNLQTGFIVLRQALESGIQDWVNAELELLHNVPSLMGERNKERHRYFWYKERTRYIDWVSAPKRDALKSRMLTYYEPIWNEMEPLIKQFLEQDESHESMTNVGSTDHRSAGSLAGSNPRGLS